MGARILAFMCIAYFTVGMLAPSVRAAIHGRIAVTVAFTKPCPRSGAVLPVPYVRVDVG